MISYAPLWKLLIDKKKKRLDVCREAGIATSTLAKMSKDQYVSLEVLDRICIAFDCRIEDVVSIVRSEVGAQL